MHPHASTSGPALRDARDAHASVTAWLGVLFLLVLLLIGVGGFVRLTGAGLSLPGWPMVEGRVLPPLTEAGWHEMHDLYLAELAAQEAAHDAGALGVGARGHRPTDLGDFRRIFMIEWSHRALALLVGVVGLACLAVLLRRPALRRAAGGPLAAIVALIVVQSVIGGVLVHTFTATHWLFVHLGVATAILGLILWTLLSLLRLGHEPLAGTVRARRRLPRRWADAALVAVFLQIVLGALVAGSKHRGFSTSWPDMNGELVPSLWLAGQGVAANLLDNPALHQWVHRWFAWLCVVAVAALAATALRRDLGVRGRIGIRIAFACLTLQVVLGVLNVKHGAALPIALAHLVVGMLLFATLVLVCHDLRHEEPATAEALQRAGLGLAPAGGEA